MQQQPYVDFQEVLNERLNTPEAKQRYEQKRRIFDFEVEFNKQLQKAGIEGYAVRVEKDD